MESSGASSHRGNAPIARGRVAAKMKVALRVEHNRPSRVKQQGAVWSECRDTLDVTRKVRGVRTKLSMTIGTVLCLGSLVLIGVGIAYAHSPARPPMTRVESRPSVHGLQYSHALRESAHLFKAPSSRAQQVDNGQAIRIRIPSIGVDAPVIQTEPVNGDWQVADWAVGHLSTTSNPGANGVIALA